MFCRRFGLGSGGSRVRGVAARECRRFASRGGWRGKREREASQLRLVASRVAGWVVFFVGFRSPRMGSFQGGGGGGSWGIVKSSFESARSLEYSGDIVSESDGGDALLVLIYINIFEVFGANNIVNYFISLSPMYFQYFKYFKVYKYFLNLNC